MALSAIVAPKGGKVHVLGGISVDESRPWDEALMAGAPQTSVRSNVRKVGHLYLPTPGAVLTPQEIFLANFGNGVFPSSQRVLAWGKEQLLRPASPRATFAIGEHVPTLNRDLALPYMVVVSLVPISFGGELHVCSVWFRESVREADLLWFGGDWGDGCWFPFVREDQ